MKNILIIIIFFSIKFTVHTQNINQQILLEKFEIYINQNEARLTTYWEPTLLYSQSRCISDSKQTEYGSTCSGVLDALLTMYETTCDISYLERFMKIATNFLEGRADRISPQISSAPYWFRDYVYLHPRILTSLSKYVYLVKSNSQNLYNTPIANPIDFGGNSTFGEFAEWLNIGNIEMMDFLLSQFWRNNEECLGKPNYIDCNNQSSYSPPIFQSAYAKSSTNTTKHIMEMNMQMPWGTSLIYMYMANQNRTDYGVKALSIVKAVFSSYNGQTILNYDSSTNSYWWYHDGWQQSKEWYQPDWSLENELIEDVGHAAFFIKFAETYNQFKNNFSAISSNYQYFEWYQMTRLRNTFVNKVYRGINNFTGYYSQGLFNTYVNGTVPDASNITPFVWSCLYKYDNNSLSTGAIDLYDIIYDHYQYQLDINDFNQDWYNGIHISGFADFIAAFYDKNNLLSGCKIKSPKIGKKNNEIVQNNSSYLNNVLIYPNPSNGEFRFQLHNISDNSLIDLEIYDNVGNLVFSNLNKSKFFSISISNLSTGVYYYNLTVNGQNYSTGKLVKCK